MTLFYYKFYYLFLVYYQNPPEFLLFIYHCYPRSVLEFDWVDFERVPVSLLTYLHKYL